MHNPTGLHSRSLRTPPVRTILRAVRSAGSASVGARALAFLRGPGKRGVKIRHNNALPGSGSQRAGRRWFGRSVRGIDVNVCFHAKRNQARTRAANGGSPSPHHTGDSSSTAGGVSTNAP